MGRLGRRPLDGSPEGESQGHMRMRTKRNGATEIQNKVNRRLNLPCSMIHIYLALLDFWDAKRLLKLRESRPSASLQPLGQEVISLYHNRLPLLRALRNFETRLF